MRYFLIYFLLILVPNLNAVEYIFEKDQRRILAFGSSGQKVTPVIEGLTKDISDKLADPEAIDYSRAANTKEKEIIFKAIIGSVVIDDPRDLPKLSTIDHSNKHFLAHYRALKAVESIAWALWYRASWKYDSDCQLLETTLKKINDQEGINYNFLLTPHFMGWFYETVSSYRPRVLPVEKAKTLSQNNLLHQRNSSIRQNSTNQANGFHYEKFSDDLFMVAEKLSTKNFKTWDEFEKKQKPKREEQKKEIDEDFFRDLGMGFQAFRNTLKMFDTLLETDKTSLEVWIMYAYIPRLGAWRLH
ncbi:hypothetical protein [Candidatus Finniella inopinata]|uniref:Uncharacterized protein n=1 Tax=Candidatus Finniella inopinata TaxID=1696036 RepID=A0A4Q7DHX3_9PROT|nr:hypothetical protein [Candidatus Finniella inopinata]RZI46551.1 hypothetical protein EQU50_02895 [Candidatus Finniella inopinata]